MALGSLTFLVFLIALYGACELWLPPRRHKERHGRRWERGGKR